MKNAIILISCICIASCSFRGRNYNEACVPDEILVAGDAVLINMREGGIKWRIEAVIEPGGRICLGGEDEVVFKGVTCAELRDNILSVYKNNGHNNIIIDVKKFDIKELDSKSARVPGRYQVINEGVDEGGDPIK